MSAEFGFEEISRDAASVRAEMDQLLENDPFFRSLGDHRFMLSGKTVRGALAVSACRLAGMDETGALRYGLVCELLHNASLIHDDLQDGDAVRRGAPSVWARWGRETALNLGDYLIFLSRELLAPPAVGAEAATNLSRAVDRNCRTACLGQFRESRLSRGGTADRADYLAIAEAKTGAILRLPLAPLTDLPERGSDEAFHLRRAISHFAVAYQIKDDIAEAVGAAESGETDTDERRNVWSAVRIVRLEVSSARGEILPPGDPAVLQATLDWQLYATSSALEELDHVRPAVASLLRQVLLPFVHTPDVPAPHPPMRPSADFREATAGPAGASAEGR